MPAYAFGNVYSTNLSQSSNTLDITASQTVNLGYLLNENADTGVTVDILDASNNIVRSYNLGAQTVGSHSVAWDGLDNSSNPVAGGNYSFRVTASDDGYGTWTKINADSANTAFFSPRGVAVNTNVNSTNYGRVYVGDSAGTTTVSPVNRATGEGIYILNADTSVPSGLAGARSGGVAWTTSSSSPYRTFVGPDDKVYVTDWTDPHSGLWVGNADFDSATELLNDGSPRAASGLTATHGSIGSVHVEGTGANRKVYTIDEDFVGSGGVGRTGSIWQYDVGTDEPFTGAPVGLYDDAAAGNRVQNFTNDLARSSDGTWWITQLRGGGAADTLSSVIQISADGQTVLWSSISLAPSGFSLTDPLRGTNGIAFDPVNDIIAIAHFTGTDGKITIFDDDTKTIITTIETDGTNRDIAFDAVGNLYVVNNTSETLKIFSPGDGVNSDFTNSLAPLGAINVLVPEPSSLAVLGVAGLFFARRRRQT
ncbi:MAG: FlgD immunoglobulin-like domain containing protein [Tepidisphaeraceae bacterium]